MAVYADFTLFKNSLDITAQDRDDNLNAALEDASRALDDVTGRRPDGFTLAETATARVYDVEGRVVRTRRGRYKLLIDEIGDASGLIVEVGDGSTWSAVSYRPAPDNALADGKPITALTGATGWGCDQVRVTAKWGWPAVPKAIRRATMILATRLYRRPGSPEGVAGDASLGAVRLARQDPDVAKLIEPYEWHGVG